MKMFWFTPMGIPFSWFIHLFDFMMFINEMLYVFSFRNTKMSHHLDDDDDDDEYNLWTFIA